MFERINTEFFKSKVTIQLIFKIISIISIKGLTSHYN